MDSAERLRMYAKQFEDQHAPQNITIGLREAADEITRLRNDVALLKTMLPPGYKYEVFRIGKGLVND